MQELYLTGNPADDWKGCKDYITHCLPQLKNYNGQEITRSDRIRAKQRFDVNLAYIREQAPLVAEANKEATERRAAAYNKASELSEHAPEVRTQMYREIAEQKEAEENKKKANMPKERDYEVEHEETVEVYYTFLSLL